MWYSYKDHVVCMCVLKPMFSDTTPHDFMVIGRVQNPLVSWSFSRLTLFVAVISFGPTQDKEVPSYKSEGSLSGSQV